MDSFIAAARKRTSKFSAAVLSLNILLGSLFAGFVPVFTPMAFAASTVEQATGGDAIDASTAGGTYTTLTKPKLKEGAAGDIGVGTIILNAPAGFEFDTGGVAPTVKLQSGAGTATCNINDVANNSVMAITSISTTQITFTVTAASTVCPGANANDLLWQNVRVRPTTSVPLTTGNLTVSGTSAISGVTGATNFGTLTEVGVTITPATGGSAIDSSTVGGAYTTLTGPVIQENAAGDIGDNGAGTIILNAPAGFIFDVGGTAPTVLVNRVTGTGVDGCNINDVADGTTLAITSRTTTQVTFTVTHKSTNGGACNNITNKLTWQGLRVRPTAAAPLASGNIVKTGASDIVGVAASVTNLGTLTEVTGSIPPKLTVTKVVTNDNGGTKVVGDFDIQVDASSVTSGVEYSYTAGAHTVGEVSDPGYAATYSGDCAPDGSITMSDNNTYSCTITNDDIAPKLTVTKVVVNDNGGTKVDTDFPLFVDATSVTTGVETMFDAGSYTISETADSGYDATISGDCATDGTITMDIGGVYSCTITNDDIAPTLTLIKYVTNDNGGTKMVADFPLFIDGNAVTSGVAVVLNAGAHTASETSDPGYQPSDWADDCATNGTITLALGENKTCSVTNDDISAQITVNVTVTNDNGGTMTTGDVSPEIDASSVTDGAANPVLVGAHTVSANALAGYTMVIGGDCASDGSITVDLADVKACSITYDDIQPLLTVTKVVVNDDGGTMVDTDFPLFVDATSVTTGVQTGFNAATYVVSETGNSGYAATFSGDCSSTGALNLGIGEVKSCTITNDDIAPTLTVTKVVVNDNGGVSIVTDFPLYIDGNLVTSGVANAVTAGTHTVSEDNSSEYEDVITGDCNGSGSITLSLAQNATCYITNDDKPAHIIVIKDVVNDNGGTKVASDFVMNVSGNNPDQTSFAGSDVGVDVTIDAGSYDVTEDADSQYAASYSADCSGSLLPGETKTCTITNDDIQPILTVIIAVTNDNTGSAGPTDFTPTVDGSSVVDSVPTGINAGVRTVSGIAHPGITGYTGSISGDCDFDGAITLLPGDVKSCTVHFDDVVPNGLSDEQQGEINDVGNGVTRGSGTSKLQAAANFVTGNLFGSIAPGAFGGGPNVPFSTTEVDVICAMQDALPPNATNGLIEWLAEYLASIMDRDAGQVLAALKDPTLCPEPVQEAVLPAAPVAFKVNAAGYPVSSNPTWNKCIAGKASLLDIRNNPDKDNHGLARDCSDYHTSNVWYHPDLHLFFTFDKKNKATTVPQGYLVQKEQAVSLSK